VARFYAFADDRIIGLVSVIKSPRSKSLVPTTQGGNAMLVLSRNLGEEIVIDGHIRIVVVEVTRNRIRLGICAPRSISVDRKEIHERRSVQWSVEHLRADQPSRPEVCA
jgi:carbon storage regulator